MTTTQGLIGQREVSFRAESIDNSLHWRHRGKEAAVFIHVSEDFEMRRKVGFPNEPPILVHSCLASSFSD